MSRILILGAGSIGKRHLKNLLHLNFPTSDIAIVEPRSDRQDEVKELGIPAENIFPDRVTALKEQKFDGAMICTPTSMHYDDTIDIAKHGIHFMLEKPIGVDLNGYDELLAEVKKNNLFAFVAYCFRFDGCGQKFHQLIQDQTYGKPLYARGEMSSYLPDWHPHEDYRDFYMSKKALGGGTLLDQSHLFDMTQWFFGKMKGVIGTSQHISALELETDDFGEMIVEMESGFIASLHIDLFTKSWREYYQVTCENGTIEWSLDNRNITLYEAGGKSEVIFEGPDYNEKYIHEAQYFLDGVKQGPSIEGMKLEDGKGAMDVICGVRESAARTFVPFD